MKITKGTIIRTVMVFIVVINFVLKRLGVELIPTDENIIASAVEMIISVLSIISAWWYNNSFTQKAKRADEFFKSLKEGEENV